MNIFASYECPIKSAMYLDDFRMIKMCVETAQILSTAVTLNGGDAPYKPTHVHHPVVKWCAKNRGNYMWVLSHFEGLTSEFLERREKEHGSRKHLQKLFQGKKHLRNAHLTSFHNGAKNLSLGIDFSYKADVHAAYRAYLTERWLLDDENGKPPKWGGKAWSAPRWE